MKFAQVIFPVRLPQSIGPFDYSIPDDLEKSIRPGIGVWVSFRNKKKLGIVVALLDSPSIDVKRIRPISSLAWDGQLCTAEQMRLMFWLEKQTHSSLATVLHSFIPDFPKKKQLTDLPKAVLFKNKKKPTEQIYIFDSMRNHDAALCDEINAYKNQIAIIAPDGTTSSRLKKLIDKRKVYDFSGTMGIEKKFEIWNAARTEKDSVFIGTRNTLLLPFCALSTILIANEEDVTHQREEQHPDCTIHELAPETASLYSARCTWFSCAPSFALMYRAEQLSLPISFPDPRPDLRWTIIDKQKLIQQHQSPTLPEDMIELFASFKKNESALLLLNRKGFAHFIRCLSCGWQPMCPTCKSGFVHEEIKKGEIICQVCATASRVPDRCPQCHGVNFRFGTPGVNEIAEKIKMRLPSLKVVAVSKNVPNVPVNQGSNIFVSTSYILPYAPWDKLTHVIVLDFDSSILFPDFRASEWTWQRLSQIKARAKKDAKLFILTSYPENHIISLLKNETGMKSWYAEQLEERQALRFPPFTSLFTWKAIFANERDKVAAEKKVLADLSAEHITASQLQPRVLHTPKGFHSLILGRIPPSLKIEKRNELFDRTDPVWKIAHNPLDLSSV